MEPIEHAALPVIAAPQPTKEELFEQNRRWARSIGRKLERSHREWKGRLLDGQAESEAELALWKTAELHDRKLGIAAFRAFAFKKIVWAFRTLLRTLPLEHQPLRFKTAEDGDIEADDPADNTPSPEPALGDVPHPSAEEPEQFAGLVASCDPLLKRLILDEQPRTSVAKSLNISMEKLARMEAAAMARMRAEFFRQNPEIIDESVKKHAS